MKFAKNKIIASVMVIVASAAFIAFVKFRSGRDHHKVLPSTKEPSRELREE